MENFTAEEIQEIENMPEVKDMIKVLDTVLDGEIYHVRTTEYDMTMEQELKPVIPKGLISSKNAEVIQNKKLYVYALQILIGLIIDLNPKELDNNEDYSFRIAIIVDAIITGSIIENKNWIESEIEFNSEFIKNRGKDIINKHKKTIKEVRENLDAAYNFLAFSSMNMVRFNHHFPNEKLNLIQKSLLGLPEDHRNRLVNDPDLNVFYSRFVPAARIVNDKLFYEKYVNKMDNDSNEYLYFKVLGVYKPTFEEEIIKIRNTCTPNSFLILDIIREIIEDLQNKKLFFIIPYKRQFGILMKIRDHLRKNPFGYHPSKNYYKCKAEDFEKIYDKFHSLMKDVGGFIYEYSECMFESVRMAKCRNKYMKSIKKDDTVLVKNIFSVSEEEVNFDDVTKKLIKEKLYIQTYNISPETDIDELNKEALGIFNAIKEEDIFN